VRQTTSEHVILPYSQDAVYSDGAEDLAKQKKIATLSQLSVLIIVQRDATQCSLFIFIILQVHSTCFGCQPHPSSGVHKTITTASGNVQLPPSNVAKLGHVGGR